MNLDRILTFIENVGLVKWIFAFMLIGLISNNVAPILTSFGSYLEKEKDKPGSKEVKVVNMSGGGDVTALNGRVVGEAFKFSENFPYSNSYDSGAFLWENGYLTEIETTKGRIYVLTTNNPEFFEEGKHISGYFIKWNMPSKNQSMTEGNAYLDIFIPVYNLDTTTNLDM